MKENEKCTLCGRYEKNINRVFILCGKKPQKIESKNAINGDGTGLPDPKGVSWKREREKKKDKSRSITKIKIQVE